MTDNPLSEEPFPNVQSKLSLTHLHSIFLWPISGHQTDEISTSSSTGPLEEVVDYYDVTSQPSLLLAEQAKLPQPLLTSFALETFHQLGWPSTGHAVIV